MFEKIMFDKNKIISDLSRIIEIPSVSSDLKNVEAALLEIMKIADEMGLSARTVLSNRVGIVEVGDGDETVGVLAHCDVVSEGDLSKWDSPPFKLTEKGGNLVARGVVDDKGAIILTLHIMKALKECGQKLFKKVQLIIGTQEEVSWVEIEEYVKKFPLPDYGYTPDGKFPMKNIEKGYADVSAVFAPKKREGQFSVLSFEAGVSVNAVPDSAVMCIDGESEMFKNLIKTYKFGNKEQIFVENKDNVVKILVKSASAHSSKPEKGVNAIWCLCNFLKASGLTSTNFQHVIDFMTQISFNDFNGKNFGYLRDSEFYNGEFIDKVVISPTTARTNGETIEFNFNIRHIIGVTKKDLADGFAMHAEKFNFSFSIGEYLEPLYVSQKSPFLSVMANSYEKISGRKNEFSLIHGTTYAKAMKNIIAWGPLFPDDEATEHEPNERISLASFEAAFDIYADALQSLVLTEKSFK